MKKYAYLIFCSFMSCFNFGIFLWDLHVDKDFYTWLWLFLSFIWAFYSLNEYKRIKTLKSLKSSIVTDITFGECDENGFADAYVNGEKTSARILMWKEDDIKKLQNISAQIHQNINK